MSNKFDVAHEKLAEDILKKFIGKIHGDNQDIIVDENPENAFFVGKLLPVTDNNDVHSSSVFIESVGLDFYIDQNQIDNAVIKVAPKGDFYYRVYPSLEQQREAIVKEINEHGEKQYSDFDEVIEDYNNKDELVCNTTCPLVPVYKKAPLNDIVVEFNLIDLFVEGEYGVVDETHKNNQIIKGWIEALKETATSDSDYCKYLIREKTAVPNLLTEDDYDNYITKNTTNKSEPSIQQHWDVYVHITAKKLKEKYAFSVSLVNQSKVFSNDITHKSNKHAKSKETIETLFNSGVEVELKNADFYPIELDYFKDDYKYEKEQYAVGSNCSVEYNSNKNSIKTVHLPLFVQKRLVTNDALAVKFEDLVNSPKETLDNIVVKMNHELAEWKKDFDNRKSTLTQKGISSMKNEIDEFQREIKRFCFGIEIIKNYPVIEKSFVLMNKTF